MLRILYLFLISILIGAGAAAAHAPSEVQLEFDRETSVLHIEFQHKVNNIEDHFVYRVRVRINGKDIIEQSLELQDVEEGGFLVYKINHIKLGDTLEVSLNCNKGGAKTGKLVIE